MKLNPNTLSRIFNWFYLQYQQAVESMSGIAIGSRTAWPSQFLTIVRGKDAKWCQVPPVLAGPGRLVFHSYWGRCISHFKGLYYGGAQSEELSNEPLDSEICSEQRTFRIKVLLIWKHIFLVYLLWLDYFKTSVFHNTCHSVWLSAWVYISCTV